MDARERRRAIMGVLERAKGPVSGSALAREVGVSRQIVVQDIALLRADGHDIVATNRGYVLQEAASSPAVPTRLVKVRHGVEQAGDELTSIVDAGGAVLNVIVNHRVYGKITADLDIRNRRDVERYLHDIESGKSFPLLTVTATTSIASRRKTSRPSTRSRPCSRRKATWLTSCPTKTTYRSRCCKRP